MTLGERIKAWREVRGLRQYELAERLDLTASAVSLWESDETAPSNSHLELLVGELGITMERFYGRIPKAKAAS